MDLLLTKFKSATKEKQEGLLTFLLKDNSNYDSIVDYLNNKKLRHEGKDVTEGEFILVDPLTLNSYPEIKLSYYKEKGLLINETHLQLRVTHINPITNYIGLEFYTKNNKFEIVDIYPSYIPDQKSFEIIL